jgi:hypothetical protein
LNNFCISHLEGVLCDDERLVVVISLDEGCVDIGGVGPGSVRCEYDPVPVVRDDAVRAVLRLVLRIRGNRQRLHTEKKLALCTGLFKYIHNIWIIYQ